MTASNIIGIAIAMFALIFLISAVWYWVTKKMQFVQAILNYSTIVLWVLIILLVIALWIEGNLFSPQPVQYF